MGFEPWAILSASQHSCKVCPGFTTAFFYDRTRTAPSCRTVSTDSRRGVSRVRARHSAPRPTRAHHRVSAYGCRLFMRCRRSGRRIRRFLRKSARIADAWLEVERVFGEKHSKWLRSGRLSDEEALEFEKLASDADKNRYGPSCCKTAVSAKRSPRSPV